MKIRLLAIDMDGTTLTEKKTLDPETLSAVCAAIDAGIMVVRQQEEPMAGFQKL